MPSEYSVCELCEGRLMVARRVDVPGGYCFAEFDGCPRCLTYAATDDVREVARECFGSDIWEQCPDAEEWWSNGTMEADPVVPLYLPAGRDLAVRVVQERGLRDVWHHLNRWAQAGLDPYWGDGPSEEALDAIPADAPPDLRTARALALCLAATEVQDGG